MLLSEAAEVKWNSRNKARLESLGYKFTGMKTSVPVKIEDLTDYSTATILMKCDYCVKEKYVKWGNIVRQRSKSNDKLCCSDNSCIQAKAEDCVISKYGSYANMYDAHNTSRTKTIIEKYGTTNVFSSKEVQERIKKTNLERYGYEVPTQNPDIRKKGTETCLKKYGVENYGSIYSGEHKGCLSSSWKGGVEHSRVERATYEYGQWRKTVFVRDMYTCQKCGVKNGNGRRIEIHAHHIENWNDNLDVRYDINNGITLCDKCHYSFHSKYGKKNNSLFQIEEFLGLDKKIC